MNLLILGNGAGAISAVKTIRKENSDVEIILVSRENLPHYPPVVLPYYIEGRISREAMFPEGWGFYKKNEIETLMGKEVKHIGVRGKKVELDDGSGFFYDKLLIATGASPSLPDLDGINNKGVFVFRTLSDAENILKHLKQKVAIIGAGPAAVELGIALKRRGLEVTLIARSRVMRRLFDPDLSEIICEILEKNGVEVLLNQRILRIEGNPASKVITQEFAVECDMVVIASGVKPNTEFIAKSEIKKGDSRGIIVNTRMQSSAEDIFAVGDCAETIDYIQGRRVVNAIWPEAVEQGRIAALNMLGIHVEYLGAITRNVIEVFDTPIFSLGCCEGEKETFRTLGGIKRYTKRKGKIVGIQILGDLKGYGLVTSIVKRSQHPIWLADSLVQ